MKKTLAILAAICLFASCANNEAALEKKTQAFETQIQELVESYNTVVAGLRDDETLSDEQKAAKHEEIYESTSAELVDLCLKTLKKNKNNSLGAEAFKTIYYELEGEQLKEVITWLGPKIKEDEDVQKILEGIAALDNTSEGKMFTDFEVNGVKFSDYIGKGKYVLVDFWASWCGPCKREIPTIAEVYKKYAGENFDVLSVAVWDKVEDTKAAAQEHGVVWNQIVDAQRIPTDIYGIQGIPQIMLFGPDGTILKRDLRGEGIEAAVKEALGL
ncbi:MAG: redoxin domain-containing protein [Candidatus Cryptobacteroides sp.]